MKRYNSSKSKKTAPSKEVIDYFPRGNTSKDDFGFNTAMLDHTSTFLSKKHKNKQRRNKRRQQEKAERIKDNTFIHHSTMIREHINRWFPYFLFIFLP